MMAGGTGILQSMAGLNSRDSTPDVKRKDLGEHGEPECNLDHNLWERLPDSLIEKIVTKFPISSLLRLGGVCKSWRNLRRSILSSEISPRCGRLFSFSEGKLFVFEIESMRGQSKELPLQYLQKQFRLLDVVASAGGLLCFRTWTGREFILCNPLTKCYRILQMPYAAEFYNLVSPNEAFTPRPTLVGILVDSDTGLFKLIVAAIPGSPGTALIYDSGADTWQACKNAGPALPVHRSNSIACGGNLYFFSKRTGHNKAKLVKYDGEQEAWSCIPLPPDTTLPLHSTYHLNVIEHNGKIFLVTSALAFALLFDDMELVAFELQEVGPVKWVRTNRLPLSGVREGMPDRTCIDCLGEGDVMFLVRSRLGGRVVEAGSCPEEIMSVKQSFHDVATNSDVFSNWEDYWGNEQFARCRIFAPSILPFK